MTTMLRVMVIASLAWLGFQILLIGYASRIPSLGRASIAWPALLAAKAGLAIPLGSMLWAAVAGGTRLSPVATAVFLAILLGGTLVLTLGLFGLGKNLRMGLPGEETVLITSGIFGYSRNPIYVGIFFMMGAALVYAFSWVSLAAAAAGVLLHHRIVLAEERFLAQQFKDYEAYRKRVRRYL